jgi:hypothetical protein
MWIGRRYLRGNLEISTSISQFTSPVKCFSGLCFGCVPYVVDGSFIQCHSITHHKSVSIYDLNSKLDITSLYTYTVFNPNT